MLVGRLAIDITRALATMNEKQEMFDGLMVGDLVGVDVSPAIGELLDEKNDPRNASERARLRKGLSDAGRRTAKVVAKTKHFVTIEYVEMPVGTTRTASAWRESFMVTNVDYLIQLSA